MRRRHTPPAPLERGGCDAAFLLVMRCLSGVVSPLERGLKGCVTVRSAVWFEEFFEEVSVCFGWMHLILGGCAQA